MWVFRLLQQFSWGGLIFHSLNIFMDLSTPEYDAMMSQNVKHQPPNDTGTNYKIRITSLCHQLYHNSIHIPSGPHPTYWYNIIRLYKFFHINFFLLYARKDYGLLWHLVTWTWLYPIIHHAYQKWNKWEMAKATSCQLGVEYLPSSLVRVTDYQCKVDSWQFEVHGTEAASNYQKAQTKHIIKFFCALFFFSNFCCFKPPPNIHFS
jgi:hypothetical protein